MVISGVWCELVSALPKNGREGERRELFALGISQEAFHVVTWL